TFRIEVFSMPQGDPSGFGEGGTLAGSFNVVTNASGNINFNFTDPTAIPLGQLVSATATNLTTNDTSEFSQNVHVDQPGTLQFSAPAFNVAETGGSAPITVTRTGGSGGIVSVQVATTGGSATAGADFADASQTLTFGDGQTSKTFTVPILTDTLV